MLRKKCLFSIFGVFFLFAGVFFVNSNAHANAAEAAAKAAMDKSVQQILHYLKDPGYANPNTRRALNKSIEKVVYSIFDFTEFSQRTVGKHWKSFSVAQKKTFTDAFAELLFATYLDGFGGYKGETMEYAGVISGNQGKRVEIRTIVTMAGNRKIPISYRMLPKGGTWKVYDVLIEGVSLVKNYRSQFSDILGKATPEQLTARVRERAAVIKKGL